MAFTLTEVERMIYEAQAVEIIDETLKILADEDAWTQHLYARDTDGQRCDLSDRRACNWCLTGALTLATVRVCG